MLLTVLCIISVGVLSLEKWEVERAHTPLPLNLITPEQHMIPSMINNVLQHRTEQSFTECQDLTMGYLNGLLTKMYGLRHGDLQDIYLENDDNRQLRISEEDLFLEFQFQKELDLSDREAHLLKASKCAEILMLYTHHVAEDNKYLFLDLDLPLMEEDVEKDDDTHDHVVDNLGRTLTCFSCHLQVSSEINVDEWRGHGGRVESCEPGEWDGNPHGWDRLRRCDEDCYDPVCGLCEGIGGIATSDEPGDYTPTKCIALQTADQIRAAGITPVIPVWPKEFTNTGFHEVLIGIKSDPFCVSAFPGPNSTFTNCYIPQEGTIYYDQNNNRLRIDYNRFWYQYTRNITEHIHHGVDPSDPYMMNIVLKKFMAGVSDFCVCASPGVGIVEYDCFSDSTYLGRELMTIEYLWRDYQVDHWVKGPHHFWVDVASGNIIRMWQPWNGLEIMDPDLWVPSVDANMFGGDDLAACGGTFSQGCKNSEYSEDDFIELLHEYFESN